jgi:hypothetical protein
MTSERLGSRHGQPLVRALQMRSAAVAHYVASLAPGRSILPFPTNDAPGRYAVMAAGNAYVRSRCASRRSPGPRTGLAGTAGVSMGNFSASFETTTDLATRQAEKRSRSLSYGRHPWACIWNSKLQNSGRERPDEGYWDVRTPAHIRSASGRVRSDGTTNPAFSTAMPS